MPRRFSNADPRHAPHGFRDVFRWSVLDRLSGARVIAPPGPPAPRVEADRTLVADLDGPPRLTWIGHASFLGSAGGAAFLVDPHLSDHAGLLFRRHVAPGLTIDEFPTLDALLLTHNHYDHLDAATLRKLPRELPVAAPSGLGRWLRRRGFREVVELGWWETARLGGVRATLVPARHWSRRHVTDVNRSWWGGWVVEAGGATFYHAGDTGAFEGFAEIGRRFPGILAAMLPVGSYAPAWFMERHHLDPEQAGHAFVDLGARYLVPMHWGTFQLTDEPLSEPPERVRRWWLEQGLDGDRLRIPSVGETLVFPEPAATDQRTVSGTRGRR